MAGPSIHLAVIRQRIFSLTGVREFLQAPISNRSGAKVFKNILFFVMIVGLLIGVFKIAPPYYKNYVLQDTIVSDARFATSYPWKTPEGLRDDVYKEVVRLGIDEVK